jgi:hypothetical protein
MTGGVGTGLFEVGGRDERRSCLGGGPEEDRYSYPDRPHTKTMSSSVIIDKRVFGDAGTSRPFYVTEEKALYPADYVSEAEAEALERARLNEVVVTVVHEGGRTEATIETSGLGLAGKVFFAPVGEGRSLTFAHSTIKNVRSNGTLIFENFPGPCLEATVLEFRIAVAAYHEHGEDPSVLKDDVASQLKDQLVENGHFADQRGPSKLSLARLVEGPSSKVLVGPRTASAEKTKAVRRETGEKQGQEQAGEATSREGGESSEQKLYKFAVGIREGDEQIWYVVEVEETSWAGARETLQEQLEATERQVAFVHQYATLRRDAEV